MIDRNTILNLAGVSGDINEYLMTLYNIPVQMNAKSIVEIGAGVSTFALVAAANKTDGSVQSIDLCGDDALNRVPGGAETLKNEPRLSMWKADSLEIDVWQDIDFLFWDSEHTLDLSRKEIARWFPLVKKGGVIMCHDTGHESPDKQGARIALDEYLETHPEYTVVHLLDTEIIGMSILVKL